MKIITTIMFIVFSTIIVNATTWVINFGGFGVNGQIENPTCSNADMSYGGSFRVVDELNSATNHPDGANIKWYKNSSGCSGTIVHTGHPYFISHIPSSTTTYYAKLPSGECLSYTLVVVNPVEDAGQITGQTTVCGGENGITYSVPAIANATSYVWNLPSGASGTSTTNSITVDYSQDIGNGGLKYITVYV